MGRSRSSRRIRRTVVATIVALSLVPSAGGAAPRGEAAPDVVRRMSAIADASRPLAAAELHLKRGADGQPVAQDHDPRDRLASAFQTEADFRDPATYVEAARELLEDITGTRVTSARSYLEATASIRDEAVVPADGSTETEYYGIPGGDLDGDGIEDVLGLELSYDPETWENFTVEAKAMRGLDGAVLWARTLGDPWDVVPIPVADMTGDGKADLLTWEFGPHDVTGGGTCLVVACAAAVSFSYHWNIRLLSGADGSQAWLDRYDGEATTGYALGGGLVGLAFAGGMTATNAVVLPIPTGDHDGDGVADLVINALDLTEAYGLALAGLFAYGYAYANPVFYATEASVVSGVDGAELFRRSGDYQPGFALLEPAGDAIGDATPDLMWQELTYPTPALACAFGLVVGACASTERSILSIEMIDGATLERDWGITTIGPVTEYSYAVAPGADLDGDGKSDLLIFDFTTLGNRVSAISGDGENLWSLERPPYSGVGLLGPVGGAPGADLLVAGFDWNFDTAMVTLDRIDGATGELVLTSSDIVSVEGFGYADIYAYIMDDADADGANDIVVDSFLEEFEPPMFEGLVRVESGATASTLASIPSDGTSWAYGLGDLTGDGTGDLLEFGARVRRTGLEIKTRAVAMPSATTAWTRADRFLPPVYMGVLLSPDLSGLGGEDLLAIQFQQAGGAYESRLHVIEGSTGETSWLHGDTFTPTPAPGTASFSGVVTDQHATPQPGICVTAHLPDGTPLLGERTGADGSYSMDELAAGAYRVRFSDCTWPYTLSDRWYLDASTFDDALDVVVTDGVDTPGINVVMPELEGPVNDLIADAIEIGSLPFGDVRSTDGAGTEAGEQEPCGFIGSTVWYHHTPAADGEITISTAGSSYDTVVAAYTDAGGPSAVIGCNDDTNYELTSELTVPTTAGSKIWIQVGGYAGDQGRLTLDVS